MAARVLKFGGAALRDGPAVRHAARLVREHGGEHPLVVVSAHEGVTSALERAAEEAARGRLEWDPVRIRHRTLLRQLELAPDLLDRLLRELHGVLGEIRGPLDRRRRDFVLSFGERLSARIVAAALESEGVPATPLDAFDLGLVSESAAGRPRPLESAAERVRAALARVPGVPVVTGYLAVDLAGNLTTLGRNGSDLSAAWIARAVGADEVQLWKSVEGVLTADPRLVPAARRLERIGWAEAAELAALGAEILHPGAVEPARAAGIPIAIRSFERPEAPGTLVFGETCIEGPLALAHQGPVALLHRPLDLGREHAEQLVRLLGGLDEAGLEPLLCELSGTEVRVLLPERADLRERLGSLVAEGDLERSLGCLAVVGRGVGEDADLFDEARGIAAAAGVELLPAPTAVYPRSRVFLTRAEGLPAALRALHEAWFEPG
jgi:aspartate kinase